jgi:hypothetical protein
MNIVKPIANEGNEKWSTASFRIAGDALRPDQITATLSLEPTQSGVKGERFSTRHSAVRRTSFWLLKCPLSDRLPLTEHLEWLLDLFEPKMDLINSIAEESKSMLLCGFSSENGQGGFTLDAKTLQRIARLGVALSVDLYPPQAAEVEMADDTVSQGER